MLVGDSVSFSPDVIEGALRRIYQKKVDVDKELEPGLLHETVNLFNRAAAKGISDSVNAGAPMPADAFLNAIKTNNEVFSAFRVHRMQNDIARMLTDGDGELKPFSQFAKDVAPYTSHQNKAWLQTEYDTAVLRAHQAADWQQFEQEKDVYPNLEWMPSTSTTPGEDHRVFWGTIRPIEDKFWNEHRPGDRWNCKCHLRNTDKQPNTPPNDVSPKDLPSPGLKDNPGKTCKLFDDNHPYMPDSCAVCPFGKGRLWALAFNKKKKCAKCEGLEKAEKKGNKTKYDDITDVSLLLNMLLNSRKDNYKSILKAICNLRIFENYNKSKKIFWTGNKDDPDFKNLIEAANIAVKENNIVYIMPNPKSIRSMDFIFVKKGIYKDYDLKTITGKNSAGNRMMESIGQTRHVLLKIDTDYNPRILAKEIKTYFETNKDAKEVLIYRGGNPIYINKEITESKKYINTFLNMWIKKKQHK